MVCHCCNSIHSTSDDVCKRAGFPKCGAFSAFWPFYTVVILDPEIARFVFETKFESFKKGERIQDEMEELLGDGIFVSDLPNWKSHRKIASRMFSMRNLRNYIFDCTVDHTKIVLTKIDSDPSFRDDVDIYNMLSRFTLDCFTAIAFGKSVDSTSIYPEKHPFAEAFDNCITNFAFRHTTPPVLQLNLSIF